MTEDRLTWHFENWAYWEQDQKSDYGDSYPSEDGSGAISGSSIDFDSMVDAADRRCANSVSAVLESVTPLQFAAVRHKHLAAVFRAERADIEAAYLQARDAVRLGLMRRGID